MIPLLTWLRDRNEVARLIGIGIGTIGCAVALTTARSAEGPPPASVAEAPQARDTDPVHSKDTLLFKTGDVLRGMLQSIEPSQSVFWRYPDVKGAIEFVADSISEIQLGPRTKPLLEPASNCRIRLSNQDEFEGALTVFDGDKVVFESWYGARMEIPRNRIQYLMPLPTEFPLTYEGPDGMEGWTVGKVSAAVPNSGEWKYKNGAFYAVQAASIARDLSLPDVASIRFDLAWKGVLSMAVALYTDYLQPINLQDKEKEPDFGGFYSLRLNPYTADLLPVTKYEPMRYLGQTNIPGLNQKSEVHVEIRVSKPKNLIALLIDGVLVKQWIDSEGFVGKGRGMRFVHQGQGAVKMSNIRISEWDGQFEERPANPPDSKVDWVKLQNGDRLTGKLQRIENGTMSFATVDGPVVEVPISRVKLVEFAGRTLELPNNAGADVRATFRGGGSVTFKLESWNQNEVTGSSSNFGRATFHPAAFERIQFIKPEPPGV